MRVGIFLITLFSYFLGLNAQNQKNNPGENPSLNEGQVKNKFSEFQKNNYLTSGKILYQKSVDEMQKNHFMPAIQILKKFILLYPDHPEKLNAHKLLSEAYKKEGLYSLSIQIDTSIYLENSDTEEGIKAWLEAAKGYFKTGQTAKARFILEKIQRQDYASNLAEEAALELKVLKILEGTEAELVN